MHRVYCQSALPKPGERLVICGDEADHAEVKRLKPSEMVEVLNGAGTVACAQVEQQEVGRGRRGGQLQLLVREVRIVAPVRPALHVRSATPKGDRLGWMIEQLSQLGAASWGPLVTARGVVDPRETKLERLGRVAVAASKQCGMAHLLKIEAKIKIDDLIAMGRNNTRVVVAAADGEPWRSTSDEPVVLAIGPEGDWTPHEIEHLKAGGAQVARFGPHIMRIETAAAAAAAIIMAESTVQERP